MAGCMIADKMPLLLHTTDKVSVALEKKAILDEYGISMEQNDEFWIEPKADDQVK